ncbi:MAG: hypothetical protein QME12_06910, partial [Nanoarchaeota archaeon]|nr:hypothetical protein [Nanoarchaeota archaeon]
MACDGNCKKRKAMATAVDQFHKWDDMVFKGIDGIPPLVNVKLSAYTMDFFMREKELLQLLFASNPSHPERTNTNIATVLYDKAKLVGIAIEYGDNEKAYVSMDKLDKRRFIGLPGWQAEPEKHAGILRARIREYTGRDIGLIKCADLMGFFGGLNKVVENPNTLEMLLEGAKFAANCVAYGCLSIQPEPKFFSYLRMLNRLTGTMDAKDLAEKINSALPDFAMGFVLQGKSGDFASVEIYAKDGKLGFYDYGDLIPVECHGVPLKKAIRAVKDCYGKQDITQDITIGLSTDFLYNAMKAALTYSPYKLGKAVFNAVR